MSRPSQVSAIAIAGSTIIAMGDDVSICKLRSKKTRIINLRGLTVLPAFTDCHVHLYSFGKSLSQINLRNHATLRTALMEVKNRGESLAKGQWLLGRGWDKNYWGLDRFPHKMDLDRIVRNPCAFNSHDGHALWVNSSALKLAGIDKNTQSPRGGIINRDANGDPSGILLEEAINLVQNIIPGESFEAKMQALMNAQDAALKAGVTGVHDFDEDDDKLKLLQSAYSSGQLELKVLCAYRRQDFDHLMRFPIISGFGNPPLRMGPLKLYADGALGSQTAALFKPYSGSTNLGVSTLTQNELKYFIKHCEAVGISCAIHAIGDRANYDVINAFLSSDRNHLPNLPRRIEHSQLLRVADIPLLKRSGAVASAQPSHLVADRDTADRQWGKRCRYAYPFKTLRYHEIPLCFGSDAPIEELNPLKGINAAVNRCHPDDERGPWYPEERITVRQAIEGFTTNAAIAGGLAQIAGKLAPGYFADLVILSENILKISKRELHSIEVVATIASGRLGYSQIRF